MSGGTVDDSFISPASNMVSVLIPSLNTWLPLPAMTGNRSDHGTCTVDDTLLVVGGVTWIESEQNWILNFLDSIKILKL
jgi:hypothetical protein